jgi:N-acetylglucosaminyldiphosphoundecaprenol N-acetyl-beta-D-mannosaminyltransferase
MKPNTRCWIANVPVDCITLEEAAAGIVNAVRKRMAGKPLLIMGPNAQLVTLAQRHAHFADALRSADVNVPDGISIVLASRLLGEFIPERVTGGDLMERLCADAVLHGLSIFLLGGLPCAAKLAAQTLKRKYPMLKVAGTYCPPLGFEHDPEENGRIRKMIADAAPDLLFVAFGAPKQEIWMRENCLSLPIGAAMSVGAALDTQAGLRKRAPRWTHKIGLEWLYRLLREPRRLWRRYLFGNTYFTYLVLRQKSAYKRLPRIQAELQSKL